MLLAMGKRDGLTDMLRPFVLKRPTISGWELLGQVASDADMTYSCFAGHLPAATRRRCWVGVRFVARVLVQKEIWAKYEMRRCWMSVRRTIGRCIVAPNS